MNIKLYVPVENLVKSISTLDVFIFQLPQILPVTSINSSVWNWSLIKPLIDRSPLVGFGKITNVVFSESSKLEQPSTVIVEEELLLHPFAVYAYVIVCVPTPDNAGLKLPFETPAPL